LYSVHHETGLRFLRRIVDTIRTGAPPRFAIGVKLNASDYVDTPPDASNSTASPGETRAFQHILEIAKWGTVDFIDISGGDYENPGMVGYAS
jgi:2,4-dienoyl-CoA reductase-like NADH-dependent reductase (Old Yellow Enzyme family)